MEKKENVRETKGGARGNLRAKKWSCKEGEQRERGKRVTREGI